MRRAPLALLVCLAGCGGGQRAPVPLASPAPAPSPPAKIAGSDLSPQEVADAAVGAPLNGGPRPERVPLPARAFDRPIARYRVYGAHQAAAMDAQARALNRALRDGDRAGARRAWTGAYEHYLRIGAAYGALGDLDAAITRDRERLEHGLWTGAPLGALRPVGARLTADARELRRTMPTIEITPLEYAVRAHEILEDAQRDMLSGLAAPYSGAGVRATAASVTATDAVIGTLHGLLAERGTLAPVESSLLDLRRELAALRGAYGGWPALDALTRSQRQRLNGRLGASLEILAKVPDALETRLPPAIPEIKP